MIHLFLDSTDQYACQPELMACLRAGYGSKRPEMPKTIEHDPNETPRTAYGVDYFEHCIRDDMANLMRFVGFQELRGRVAEMLNEFAEGKRR